MRSSMNTNINQNKKKKLKNKFLILVFYALLMIFLTFTGSKCWKKEIGKKILSNYDRKLQN
jgi:hypothetical protein